MLYYTICRHANKYFGGMSRNNKFTAVKPKNIHPELEVPLSCPSYNRQWPSIKWLCAELNPPRSNTEKFSSGSKAAAVTKPCHYLCAAHSLVSASKR